MEKNGKIESIFDSQESESTQHIAYDIPNKNICKVA